MSYRFYFIPNGFRIHFRGFEIKLFVLLKMTLTVLRVFLTESSSSLELLELLEPLVERWGGLGLILGPAGTNIT